MSYFQIPVFAEMKCLLMVCACLCFISAHAEKDSTRWDFRAKGVDVKIGVGVINMHRMGIVNILRLANENGSNRPYDFSDAKQDFIGGEYYFHTPFRAQLAWVWTNDYIKKRRLFRHNEFRFGLNYEHARGDWYLTGIRPATNSSNINAAYFSYVHTNQNIEFGCQSAANLSGRCAFYGGINIALGFCSFKKFEIGYGNRDLNVSQYSEGGSYGALFQNVHMNFGFKLNLSCEYNLFVQYEYGLSRYGSGITNMATSNAMSAGLRLKFVDDSEKERHEATVFW